MEELRHRKYSETLALFDLTILSNVDSLTSQSLQDKAEKYRDMLFPWITVERPKFWINDNLDADELKKFGLTMEDA
jgi:hypothetical protein